MMKINELRVLYITVIFMMLFTTQIFGATVTNESIAQDVTLPTEYYYFVSPSTYVYKTSAGTCSDLQQLSNLTAKVKNNYFNAFTKGIVSKTATLNIFDDIKYEGESLKLVDPLVTQNVMGYCSNASGYFCIQGDSKYKFYLPKASDANAKELLSNSNTAIALLIKSAKEGVIAGSIELGFNIGTVYSEKQLPLSTVMTAISKNNTNSVSESKETDSTSTSKGQFFNFNENYTLKATLEYFLSPLFGKIQVKDLPKTDAEWNAKVSELSKLISSKTITINNDYFSFVKGESADCASIKPVGNFRFDNGVKAYKDGITTKEPAKMMNYNMQIAVPYKFEKTFGDQYRLKADGLRILDGVTMSVFNDAIFQINAETKAIEQVCTNADIDLDRKYLAFFNQHIAGQPVGVVIVLKYDEGIVDTSNNNDLYITGRKIAFGGNYSTSLKLNLANLDSLYFETKTSGRQAMTPVSFAFIPDDTTEIRSFYNTINNHIKIDDDALDKVVCIDFTEIKAKNDNTVAQEIEGKRVFVIIRNNNYINDGQLLNWLATDEAKAMPFVYANILRQRIKGEFKAETPLSYTEWKTMQNIKADIKREKDNFLISAIRVLSIIFGALLIILGILFTFAYWFDIFNTFTDFSILYFISAKNMYPIADKDSIQYVTAYEGKTRFVTFKDVLIINIICIFLGIIFMEFTPVIELISYMYTQLMNLMG